MVLKTNNFDIAEYLETPEDVRDFLEEVLKTGTEDDFIHALNIAARAAGMTVIAQKAGVTRASLYKSLSEGSNPGYKTVSKVTRALGCRLTVAVA